MILTGRRTSFLFIISQLRTLGPWSLLDYTVFLATHTAIVAKKPISFFQKEAQHLFILIRILVYAHRSCTTSVV